MSYHNRSTRLVNRIQNSTEQPRLSACMARHYALITHIMNYVAQLPYVTAEPSRIPVTYTPTKTSSPCPADVAKKKIDKNHTQESMGYKPKEGWL
jgi:hypothetical protein